VHAKFKVGQKIHESLLHTRLNDAQHKIFLKMSLQILCANEVDEPYLFVFSETKRRLCLRLVKLGAVSVNA